ncbi:GntR family transcriptional regulator [Neopusillimonas aromaticivorans]|uniref:GntR family transcriptional regulator n=1 Tax=Neopusillimonas aromaticivorans TaxID=2979868 RepID=UPI0025996361|nr:GntR family transcriptional regulator [Neopusillimonas aromaticivorans]WJJ93858.1 GntR family transcriptional regulator [Neopusillimonas aromaticivorans]
MLYLDQRSDSYPESTAPSASSLLGSSGHVSEVDRVYAEIFDAVMDRRLLPGAKLTESTLCEIFNCSRATVRSALAQLGHDKIVVLEPNRGPMSGSQGQKKPAISLKPGARLNVS